MDLLIERDGKFEQRTLADGAHRPGEADGVPARLGLVLFVEGERLSIESAEPVRVGGVLLPPRLRRLVMPGEPIEPVRGCVLRIRPEVAEPQPATRAIVRRLLDRGVPTLSASLVSLTGLDAGRSLALGDKPVVIGRGDGAELRIRDRAVSRVHARVSPDGDRHAIEDLGTSNGVHVNGSKVIGRHLLEEGDLVELGQTLLRYGTGRAAIRKEPSPSTAPADEASAGTGSNSAQEAPAAPGVAAPAATPGEGEGEGEDGSSSAAGQQDVAVEGEVIVMEPPEAAPARSWLLASGAGIVLVGAALTFGCLSLARSTTQARSGASPARSTTSAASRR